MFDTLTIVLSITLLVLSLGIIVLRSFIKKAKNITQFQTYSKSVEASLIETGVFTEHGIVYDASTNSVRAQHKRSQFFYESVL